MNRFLFLLLVFISGALNAQKLDNIKNGEVLTYRIHYGVLNAGTATLTAKMTNFQGAPHFYVKGVGRSAGAVRAFFKVDDIYESFINYQTGLPSFYVRNVSEGSYRQYLQAAFNHNNHTVLLTDKKNPKNGSRVLKTAKGVQDMISSFYYLRSFDAGQMNVGDVYHLNVWIDDEMFPFRLKVVGTQRIKTKFGYINCLKIIPSVMSGRVFKDKEGVTLWVTNDGNHIPVAVKAELAVGSLKADLDSFKNVKYPLKFTN